MNYTVMFLEEAEKDLRNIYNYIKNQFSLSLAQEIYVEIKYTILLLQNNIYLGQMIPQLEALGITNYRYLIVKNKNKIIYEIDEATKIIYIYLICNDRQDFESSLEKRLLHR